MTTTIPDFVSARDLQRKTSQVLNRIQANNEPTVIVRNSKPAAAIISISAWKRLMKRLKTLEAQNPLKDIIQSEREYKAGKAKKLKGSLLELINAG